MVYKCHNDDDGDEDIHKSCDADKNDSDESNSYNGDARQSEKESDGLLLCNVAGEMMGELWAAEE